MELLRSLKNQFNNRGIITQSRLRQIHSTLLECLENNKKLLDQPDYQPGRIELSQESTHTIFSRLLPLVVSRDYVMIFPTERRKDALIIRKKLGGGYVLIRGDDYNKTGRSVHENVGSLPSVLFDFIAEFGSRGERRDITVSYIS